MWGLFVRQNGAAFADAGHDRQGVGNRTADDEQPVFLAHHVGGHSLQTAHRRIALAAVVTDLGFGHGLAHGIGGKRNGIAAKIDQGHFFPSAGAALGLPFRANIRRANGQANGFQSD